MIEPERYERLHRLFAATRGLEPGARGALLDRACADDPDLRSQIEDLLAKHDDTSAFLGSPALGADFSLEAGPAPEPSLVGHRLGGVRLTCVIAAGGMGTVYEAEQDHPRRTVAVKVMRQGMTSRSALRRFEYETQILARLRHPGIAQVYEAGTCDDAGGVPYFVMEYIPGARPITEFARDRKLSTLERLELFARVCDAVYHGHQRGIIHRDLKPANILIDSTGAPKIIDFGVARATDADVSITTIQTDLGKLIGTLQYMSPEQCLADPHDLDTRSDVYALGVVLYELICDRLPYDLTHLPVHEAARLIREESPTRPSTIERALRGDVETIVLKALEKDRDRRYASVAELARDLRRYLDHEPIVARPPSVTYQLRMLARRNRAAAGALVTVMVVLAAGAVVSLTFAVRATREAEARRAAELEAVDAKEDAERRHLEASTARGEAETVTGFLAEMLASADPEQLGRDVLVKDVLDEASRRIPEELAGKPVIEARLRHTVGNTYQGLGEYASAQAHLERALELRRRDLGDEHADTVISMHDLGYLYHRQGRLAEAEALFVEAVQRGRQVLGEDDPTTLGMIARLGDLYRVQGRHREAEQLLRPALETSRRALGSEHEATWTLVNNLGVALRVQERLTEAEPLLREGLEISRRLNGADHMDTLFAVNNLANTLQGLGRLEEAEPLFRASLDGRRKVFGPEHPSTLTALNNLAHVVKERGELGEAESLFQQTIELRERILGPEHPKTLISMNNLAHVLLLRDRLEQAEALYRETLDARRRTLGPEHPATTNTQIYLAKCLAQQKRFEEAESLQRQAVELSRQARGADHLITIRYSNELVRTLRGADKPGAALELAGETVALARQALPEDHWEIGHYQVIHGRCLIAFERYDEAEAEILAGRGALEAALGGEHARTRAAHEALAELYEAWGRPEQAADVRAGLSAPAD